MKHRLSGFLLAVLTVGLNSCGRDEIVFADPQVAPGPSARTWESLLTPDQLVGWADTVFSGYSSAYVATFILVEEGTPELASRGLFRFDVIQDSVFFPDTTSAVVSFDSARVVIGLDTLRSVLASSGTTLRLVAVEDEWDRRSASWEFAVDTANTRVPWTGGPGGSLGVTLSEIRLTEFADSIIFDLGARSDSLLRSWNDTTEANPGLALLVADSGHLVVQAPRVQYTVVPELIPDTTISLREFATARTFIFDRTASQIQPGALRLGGVDGWRMLAELVIPDSVPVEGSDDRFELRGAVVNKAELVFQSLAPPDAPFAAEDDFLVTAFQLATDYRVLGAKTPVGNRVDGSDSTVEVDSLQAGSLVSFDMTREVQRWSRVPFDSTPQPIRVVFRSVPEGATFGFWEFGSVKGDPGFAPVLRIVFTPPVEFEIP